MARQVATANRLVDGAVIYAAADDSWSEWLDDALVAATEAEEAELLAQCRRAIENQTVADEPYLVEVVDRDGKIWPAHIKEVIRAQGPTTRLDLGKQAETR